MTTANISDGEALLRGILEDPGDDAVRLVYADWLEDNGEHGRANAIRAALTPPAAQPRGAIRPWRMPEVVGLDHAAIFCKLATAPNGTGFMFGPWHKGFDCRISRGMLSEVVMPLAAFTRHAESLFRRHPITTVRLSDQEPYEASHGAYAWFANRHRYRVGVSMSSPHWLPIELAELLPVDAAGVARYPTAKEAEDALSRACVDCGRALAGLPLLKGTERK